MHCMGKLFVWICFSMVKGIGKQGENYIVSYLEQKHSMIFLPLIIWQVFALLPKDLFLKLCFLSVVDLNLDMQHASHTALWSTPTIYGDIWY